MWDETRDHFEEWMIEARTIAVADYWSVVEECPDFCSLESSAQYGDHGEELSDMYTAARLDEDGKPVLGRARMT
jgi:hypothetical protein